MNFPCDAVKITPIYLDSATIGTALTGKTRYIGQGDFSVFCCVHGGTLATGLSASDVGGYGFVLTESSAATVNGSAISGATLNLGAATLMQVYGAPSIILKVATNCATTVGVTINGITYHGTAVGATAGNGGYMLSRAINGYGTSQKLPHYRACASFTDKTLMRIEPEDDLGTGLEVVCTAAGATIVPYMTELQGFINVGAAKLSTVSPKYIGVNVTPLTALSTGAIGVFMMAYPTGRPAAVGRITMCATGVGG
jgi:hypothetical protein